MKLKTIVGILFVSLSANAGSSFLEVSAGKSFYDTDNMAIGSQPAFEIVGGDASVYELKYGFGATSYDKPSSQVFLFISSAPEKNNEFIYGIGAKAVSDSSSFNQNLYFTLGAKLGLIDQRVKGDRVNTSTNTNKLGFVMGGASITPTTITYEEDTTGLSIALNLGAMYKISSNLYFNTEATYRSDYYQVAYRNDDSRFVLNALTFRQDNYVLNGGISYYF